MTRQSYTSHINNGNMHQFNSHRRDFFHDDKENFSGKQTTHGYNNNVTGTSLKLSQQPKQSKKKCTLNASITLPPNKRDVQSVRHQSVSRNLTIRRNSRRIGNAPAQPSEAWPTATSTEFQPFSDHSSRTSLFNSTFQDTNIQSGIKCNRGDDVNSTLWADASFPTWNDFTTSSNNTDAFFFDDFSQTKENNPQGSVASSIPSLSPPKRDTIKRNSTRRKNSINSSSSLSTNKTSFTSFFDNNDDEDTEQEWNLGDNIYSSAISGPPSGRNVFREGAFKGNDSLAFSACLQELAILRRSDSASSEFSSSLSETSSMMTYSDSVPNVDESLAWKIVPTPKDISLASQEPTFFDDWKENVIEEPISQPVQQNLALAPPKETRRRPSNIQRNTSGSSISSVNSSSAVVDYLVQGNEETSTVDSDPSIDNYRQYERALRAYYVGREFFIIGRLDDSMDSLRESMQHFETYNNNVLLGSSSNGRAANVQLASCLFGIASIHLQKKDYKKAMESYEKMIHILFSAHGRDYFNQDSAEAYHKLGFICYVQKNYEESLLYLKKALQAYRSLSKKQNRTSKATTTTMAGSTIQQSSSMIGIVLNNTGNVYHKLGMLSQALSFYKQALQSWSSNGKDSILSYSVSAWNNIGVIHFQEGNCEKSVEAYGKVLQILSHRMGSNHHHSARNRDIVGDKVIMARTLTMIGFVNSQLGDMDDSISSFKAAQAIYKSIFGDNNVHVAEVLEYIGYAQESRGEIAAALVTYKKVWEVRQFNCQLRDNHPSVVRILKAICRLTAV